MAKLSRDLSVGTLHPREALFAAGNLASLNAEVIVPGDGAASVSLDLRGTFVGTVEVSFTTDGTNWVLVPIRSSLGGLYVTAVTTFGNWVATVPPCKQLRARMTAYTSGTAAAVLLASTAPLDQSLMGAITPLIGTNTGAAGAAVTLTLASPGTGLRHYLTYLRIVRFATALLTAAAAPVVVTTTNLPGSLAFSLPADAAAQGTVFAYQEDFSYPIAASAQATATTIVCPATTGVIWRVTAGFNVAP
jgi:hypothetical protein